MKKFIPTLLISTFLLSCQNEEIKNIVDIIPDIGNESDIFNLVYNNDNLESQNFEINTSRDTTLISAGGVTLRLFENSFVTPDGEPVEGNVLLEFKEALTKKDFILGNLITLTEGKMLESNGMIYLNATSNGEFIQLAEDKVIGIAVPTDTVRNNMSIYQGEECYSEDTPCESINWVEPEEPLNKRIEIEQRNQKWVRYSYDHAATQEDIQAVLDYMWDNNLWDHDGEEISYNNTSITITSHETIPLKISTEHYDDGRVIQEVIAPKGVNAFVEDYNTNYIFSIKKLGWANIDRLYEDPRTKEIDMITEVKNKDAFKTVYITLMFESKNIYLTGYQMENGSYCFSHGDYEKTALPIGEKAVVLATGYKKGNPFFDLQHITIADELVISMNLKETTMDKLKERLEMDI